MDIPVTALILIESSIVGVLLGSSTIAVISYALSLRYGYPGEGVGHRLIQSIYTLIRLFHIFFAVLVIISLIVFGFFDGIIEARYEYGIKAAVLFVQALAAYGMARRLLPFAYTPPVLAAGWYFLALYHTLAMHSTTTGILLPALVYLAFIVAFQIVFILIRRFYHPA